MNEREKSSDSLPAAEPPAPQRAGLDGPTAPGHGAARVAAEATPVYFALTVAASPPASPAAGPLPAAQVDTISERDSRIAHGPPEIAGVSTAWRLDASSTAVGGADPRYFTSAELGRGGMGRVMEAFDRRLGRVVALKESFAADEDGRQRFDREVAITARLEHPSIVPLYDAGVTADGRAYYVMRKVSGRGLDRVMASMPTLDERLGLLPSLLAACDAVAHAHARQVVHRDLKPANILVGDYGETIVIDWGLAKAIGESEPPGQRATQPLKEAAPPAAAPSPSSRSRSTSATPATAPPLLPDDLHTVAGAVFGTPGFMSPEQARGEALDTRGDVYALGATLYHLLAGQPPHVGKSATEVIDRVRVAPPTPLARACPGAPVELVAITEKAMAFAIEDRYPDASALAGDLRRFLAGQLVAAHRYTFWQRVRRAARTYRSALLVAGASLLALSALATVSVIRIVDERNEARSARRVAVYEAQVAKRARDQASARADELIVARAQSLVTDDPTAAAGLLKRLPPDSPAWPRARMVAMGALAEGVARAVPGSGSRPPAIFSMSPNGDWLLVGEDLGRVWVLDLERTRARDIADLGGRPRGCWVSGGASILLVGPAGGVMLRELATGAIRPVQLSGTVSEVACTSRGPAIMLDTEGEVWVLDPALAQARKLATGLRAQEVDVSRDGATVVASNDREVILLDRDGAVLQRVTGEVISARFSAAGKLAVMLRDRVVELSAAGEVLTSAPLPKLGMALYWVGERLRVLVAGNRIQLVDGTVDVDLPSTPAGSAAIGEDTSAIGLSDGSVWLTGWWGSRVMHSPAVGSLIRIAAQPGAARLAGWSRGTVLVWNLGGAIPRRLSFGKGLGRMIFIGEDQLAVSNNEAWHWIDLQSGKTRRAEHQALPLFNDASVDALTGDTMLLDHMLGRAMLVRWDKADLITTWRDRASCAALLGGGAVAVGTSDGRLAVGHPDAGLKIFKLEAPVVSIAKTAEQSLLAIDADGGTFAYDMRTAAQSKGALGEPPSGPIVGDGRGGAIIATGARLWRWHQGQARELAQLGEPILRLARYGVHIGIQTSAELLTLDLDAALAAQEAGVPPVGLARERNPEILRRIAGLAREQQLFDGSRWAIGVGQRGLIELVDIATGVRWTKAIHGGLAMFAVSPNGSRVAQMLSGEIALWSYDVPEEPAALRAWLDELTNADVDDNLGVAWGAPGR